MNQPFSVPRSILGADRAGNPVTESHSFLASLPAAPDVVEYWRRIMARKWLVISVTVATIALGLLYVLSLERVYEATATVVIEDGRNEIVQIREIYSGTSGNRDHFTTQSEFIGSRNVAERVIRQFDLLEHPAFDPRQAEPSIASLVIGWIKGLLLGPGEEGPPSEQELLNSVVRTFSRNLSVHLVPATQLVRVRFASTDPVLAANIANAVVAAYIDADMDARYTVAKQAHGWLSEHVGELRRNLTVSELALQSYRDAKGMIDRESAAQGGASRELEATMQRLVEARLRRSQAEQQYEQIRGRSIEANQSAPAVLSNASVARARAALADAQRQMADASVRFGSSHPQYQLVASELQTAQAGLRESVQAVVSSMAKEFETARAVERALEEEVAGSRGTILGQNRDELELASYEQEVATNRQLYETFLARLKETNIVTDIQNPIARPIDRAVPPSFPDRPARVPLMLAFAVGGLVFGIAIALFRHRLDDTLSSVDQVENTLSLPVISALARVNKQQQKNLHQMFLDHPESGFSEGIRTARTAIRLATVGAAEGSVIMVGSSLPQEGKSTVAFNLALAQAQVANTLLIECDIRRPTYAKRIGLSKATVGLAECLRGSVSVNDCLFRIPQSNLTCLFAGRHLEEPLELLSSGEFPRLLDQLRSRFETIIIDTPPVALVSDALALAEHSDGIVLVIRAHSTSRRLVAQSIQSFSRVSTPIIGTIVNQLDVKRARKYYGEYGVYDSAGYGGYGGYNRSEHHG